MTTAETTLEELMEDFNAKFTATADEITAWNAIDPCSVTPTLLRAGKLGVAAAEENTVETKVGLWGQDLTDFLADCETSDNCDPADYDGWNGWGVGVHWSGVVASGEDGVIFEESLQSIFVSWGDTGANELSAGLVEAVEAQKPSGEEAADLEAPVDAFEGWGADPQIGTDEEQFAFYFFEDGADFHFEAEDTTSVWASLGAKATYVDDNVNTAEFVLVGAASLTAATSVIVASLLF